MLPCKEHRGQLLLWAAERGKWDTFSKLLRRRNPSGLNDTDSDGNTILHLAARAGEMDV